MLGMAKRGETRPWRVRYVWDTGIKGTATFGSEDEALWQKSKIEDAAELQDRTVTVTIERRQ